MYKEQQINYLRFNDIIVFDNTYQTNRFDMPFGIFTGVNNYEQSTCFAGTLMISETSESFIWVFEHFLKLMNHHALKALLTDNDRGITQAWHDAVDIDFVFWHLLKNIMKIFAQNLEILGNHF